MKVRFPALLLITIISNLTFGNTDLTGYWHGAVDRFGAVQLIEFNFYNDSGELKGIYNIPDMGLYEVPVEELHFELPVLTFKIFMGNFDMKLDTISGEITGVNESWKPSINIHLKKMLKPSMLFTKEYITIYNKSDRIASTLFKPVNKTKFPVVILIHGAENPRRSNWRYRYFAYLFANNGYGVLIYDKQGLDSSTGNPDADFYELAEDVGAAAEYLSKRNDVEADKIGVLGGSRGGWVAEVCAANIEKIRFAVLFLGPSQSVWEQQIDAVEYRMKQENFQQSAIDTAAQNNRMYFETVNNKRKWSRFKTSLAYLKGKEYNQYLQLPETYNDSDMVWWRNNNYNPEHDLKNVKCPVLSVLGEDNVLVPPDRNYDNMQRFLSQSGQTFEIKIIPGLPHNVHLNQTLRGGEWKWPNAFWVWPKKSIVLEETVLNWLNKICGE